MGTTSKGYPYPEGTDLVVDGDDAIEALAEAIDAKLPAAMTAGNASIPNAGGDATKSVTVTFPSGLFTVTPYVTIAARTAYPEARSFWGTTGANTSSFQAVNYYAGASATLGASWVAVQPDGPTVQAFASPLADPGDMVTVTCPTPGCRNEGVPIQIAATWVDDEGGVHDVDAVCCGVCGADLTSSMTSEG